MKKLVLLVVLALTLTASMAGATTWTSYLTSTESTAVVQLDLTVEPIADGYSYLYKVYNPQDYARGLDEFNISFDAKNLDINELSNYVTPSGWALSLSIYGDQISWNTDQKASDFNPILPGSNQTFGFWSKLGPLQPASAAAIDGVGFSGTTGIPTPVPEASTMVGFGSALLMAGPGMVGWIRRRRS